MAEPDADPTPAHSSRPSTPARAAAAPSAAKGGDAQAESAAPAVAPDDPNPTEAELAEARQRRKWREEHLGHNPDDETLGAAGGAPEVDADGYYEESRWYEFAVDDLAAADGAELVPTDDDGEGGEDDEEAVAADAAQSAGSAGSSRPGVYCYAESELSAAAGEDAVGARGTAQARAEGGAPAGAAGAWAAGAAAAATEAASEVAAAVPAAGAPAAAAAFGDAAEARPAPSSPFVVPKLAYGSPAERAAAAGRHGAEATATPDPASNPGKAGPTSPLPLPFGVRVGARLQQMGVRASNAGAAGTGTGLPAGASTPQATSAHRPRAAAPAVLGSGPGGPAPYVQGAAPPPAGGASSSARPQAPRTSAAGAARLAARAPLSAPLPGIETHTSGAAGGGDVGQVAATALAGGGPEPQGEEDGAAGEAAAGAAAAGDGEQARLLTAAELRDVAQRRGLSFEALVQGARERGVEVEGD